MNTFTIGQVATICNVRLLTAKEWTDSGRLACYRIPGSNHRRIPREALTRFMDELGLSTDTLTDDDTVIKPRPGRPRTDNPMVQRQIRATQDDWDRWKRCAEHAGMTLSSWLRAACCKAEKD